MRFVKYICLALIFSLVSALPVSAKDPFSIRTSLTAPQSVLNCTIATEAGQTLALTAADLERRLEIESGSLEGMTLTSVPEPARGILFLDGIEVEAYDYLTRGEIDRLCFVPMEGISSAQFTFVPQCGEAVSASLRINVLEERNLPPEIEGMTVETMQNIAVNGYIPVLDPEEESITLRLRQGPKKGQLRLNGQSFTYEPFRNVSGKDMFVVCAIDGAGNFSADAVINVEIEGGRSSFVYLDMTANPSHYAAVKLKERGVITGKQVGDAWFFGPNEQMNRGDFLVLLLAAMGKDTKPTINTGLPNDTAIPLWLKPYVKAAIEEGIISSQQSFRFMEIPIRAEAVLMTGRASGISDVKDYSLYMGDRDSIPEWAVKSYKDLAAYKMLDLHDGNAYPNGALTASYAVDLVWQLYKHIHR